MTSNFSVPFFINSKDRVSGDINDANYIFRDVPQNDTDYSVLLSEFQIQNDFYNINQYNNQFILGPDLGTTSLILPNPITIPSDNYSGTSFANYITDNAGTLGVTGLGVSYDSSSLNLTFTNNSSSIIYLEKTNDKSKYLGIDTNSLLGITNGTSYITDKADFSGTSKIIIE